MGQQEERVLQDRSARQWAIEVAGFEVESAECGTRQEIYFSVPDFPKIPLILKPNGNVKVDFYNSRFTEKNENRVSMVLRGVHDYNATLFGSFKNGTSLAQYETRNTHA
jgi:hypothetical protein